MTKLVTVLISGNTQAAVDATARRFVNTTDNVVNWANINHKGLIDSVTSSTQDVTVVKTKAEFIKDANGDLVPRV